MRLIEYLVQSIDEFVNQEELLDIIKSKNFYNASYKNLSGGIVSLHTGWKYDFNKLFILFKIGRKIGKSNIINIVSETHKIPLFIKIFFNFLAFSFSSSNDTKSKSKENLSESIQEMGTTFIKLGQFLATRPDIIGEKLSKELESLQDKLPPFSKKEAKKIIIENLGQSNFDDIIDLSEPIAAASIAQVHKAKIKEDNIIKNVAIKVFKTKHKENF